MSKFEMDDVDLDLGMSEDELEELMESGDEDAIARALGWDTDDSGSEDDGDGDVFDVSEEDIEAAQKQQAKDSGDKKGDTDGTSLDAGQQDQDEPAGKVRKVVKSRDGKHEIPYEVLEAAREKASRAGELEETLHGTKAELEEARRLNEQLKKQLEENDLTPADVLKATDLDDATLESLSEYGDLGEVVRALALQNKQLLAARESNQGDYAATPTKSVDPIQVQVNTAIANNPDLSDWQKNDRDKWDMAVIIDNQLRNDPGYQNATFEERFAEAARRTKRAFGEPVDEPQGQSLADKAAERVREAAKSQHPQSLTDVGRGATQTKSRAEIYAEMSESQLAAAMEDMTPDQVEELLASLE